MMADSIRQYLEFNKMQSANVSLALCQAILLLLCLACYHHALNGEYVFDDSVAIVRNGDVTSPQTNLSTIFRHDFWGAPITSTDSHKSYRPLTTLMFRIEYQLGMRAKHMKLINLMMHCVNTLLVWHFLRALKIEHNTRIATVAAALFAVHPVHTEAVCGVVGRAELMFSCCYLLALLVNNTNNRWQPLVTVTLTAVGMLFKETAITTPLACVFVKYMQRRIYMEPWREQLRAVGTSHTYIYACATVVLILLRLWVQDFEGPRFKPMDNPVAFDINPLTRILSQNFLYIINFWILLCPQWLSFDWALGCMNLITNIWDLRLQAVLGLYSFAMVSLINYKYNAGPIVGLGLMVIPFLPASGIITVGFVIAERVLYVPSIGFCFLVAYSFVYLNSLLPTRWTQSLLKWMLMLVFVCFILRCRQRAREWLTEEQLFKSALDVCPRNAKVHYNIARLASDNADETKAFYHYHKAIELHPQYESALMNLGNLYRSTGDLVKAEKYLKDAINILPEFPAAWMNLGIVQSARKNYPDALQSYLNALKYRKNYAICYFNLGNLFLDQKQYSEAMQHWQKAVALNPRQPKAWANILTMLDSRGLHEDAVRLSETALVHLPNETSIIFIRANALGKLKHYVEAETLYKRAIEMDPQNVLFITNLGVLYHRWDKLDLAIASYERAVQINPKRATNARNNLDKILMRTTREQLVHHQD